MMELRSMWRKLDNWVFDHFLWLAGAVTVAVLIYATWHG